MRTSQTFSLEFIKRTCRGKKKKGKAHIYARIWVDGEAAEISLKEEINETDWDPQTEQVKGRSIQVKSLNDHILAVGDKIRNKYRVLQQAEALITAESIKREYLGIQSQLKGHKLIELMAYYKKIWEPELKPGGFKNVKTTVDYVERFLKETYNTGDIYLSQVTTEFATNLKHYIRTNPIDPSKPCEGNGLAKHIQRFKRILNWAEDDINWIKANPCAKFKSGLKKVRRKKLSFPQVVAIEQQHFADATIAYVRELFLFSIYAGFAFVDVMALREHHFEWEDDGTVWCKLYRTKSEELSAVRVLAAAAKILDKYRSRKTYVPGQPIFPSIANQTVNEKLKIIQAVCGIQLPLTFHLARHTFAKTIALKCGIPIETVQLLMGHAKITTTMIYAEVDEEKMLDDTDTWEEKLARKREVALAQTSLQKDITRPMVKRQIAGQN
jgi:integrase